MASTADPVSTVASILARSYAVHGNRVAVRDRHGHLTYHELGERARRIAGELLRRGVRAGDRVMLVMNNRIEFPQIEHALALGGFVRACAITRLHPHEIAHIVADADPSMAFIEETWLAEAGADFRSRIPCPVVVVGADAKHGAPDETFDAFLAGSAREPDLPEPGADDLAWFMYTSGSTGKPKGVMHTQRTVGAMIGMVLDVMKGAGDGDVALHSAPLSHFSGAVAHAIFAAGGENVLLERFQPDELFDAVARHRVSVMPLVPTQLNMVTEYLRATPRDVSTIRILPYAGSAIPPDRLAAATDYFGSALVQYYGSSEVPMPITALEPRDHVAVENELGLPRFASAGRVWPGVEVSIRDAENRPAPTGTPGEIVARSPVCCKGYWRNDEATREIVEPDGFVHTGDVGVLDAQGFLFIVDRKKDMIVTGGFNVFPREVENAISTMPGVLEVAVVSAPDDKWGEAIVAVVAPKPGCEVTLARVQEHCRETLAGYKVPRRLELMDALPKGGTGKLLKTVLRDKFWGERQRRVGG